MLPSDQRQKTIEKSKEWIQFAYTNDPLFCESIDWLKANYGEANYEKLLALIAAERFHKTEIFQTLVSGMNYPTHLIIKQ